MKTCTMCGLDKPASDYHRKKQQASGLNPSCKECVAIKSREYYAANASRIKDNVKNWSERNADRVKERAAGRYRKKADAIKAAAKEWASLNKVRRKEIAEKSAEKNRSRKNEQQRIANREFYRLYPDVAREEGRMRAAIRRSRAVEAGINIKRSDWRALIDFFETGVCLYCKTYGHKLTMDHWIPVSLGGKTEVGNLIPCCKSCNSRKSNKHPDEWMKIIGETDERGLGRMTIPQFLELTREALIEDEVAA